MKIKLTKIADIQFGVYYKDTHLEGEVKYLLVKDFDNGIFLDQVESFVKDEDVKADHLLKDGDVLLVSKGSNNFAYTYDSSIGPAIASSIFFVLKPIDTVYPGYLSVLFNSKWYQDYFQVLGAGSNIVSIRKSELKAMEIDLPELEKQSLITKLNNIHLKEIGLLQQLIVEKKNKINYIINQLTTK